MAKKMGIYKCEICGNIVEVLHEGKGELVCCGQPMKLQEANTVEAAYEKHIPVVERTDAGILVKVGSIAHPMLDEHYIEWVEVIFDNRVCRHDFKPGEVPEAF
ncbi:MAG: desulfoferrodoxin, partial [Methanomassiliicoccales archaeon]